MAKGIISSLLTGKKTLLTALVSFIALLLVWIFAYHTTWGQLSLIALFIYFLFSISAGIKNLLGFWSDKRRLLNAADKIKYPDTFIYQFYRNGFYTKNQDLEDSFTYNSFQLIQISETGIQFVFCPKSTKIGFVINKKYKIFSFFMPFSTLNDGDKLHIIDLMKEMKSYMKNIKISKELRLSRSRS